jgi:uncharacterized membrane protein HdeD (DUF308 family)
MATILIRSWKALAWRGVLALSFGFIAFLWPKMTFAVLVLVFGVYALLDGFVAIAMGTRHRAQEHAWVVLLEGLAGLGLGLAVLLLARTPEGLVIRVIGVWAVTTGILEVFAFVRLRRDIPGEFLLGIAGAASILLGSALLFGPSPAAGTMVIIALLGSYALVFGASMLGQALRLRRAPRDFEHHAHGSKPWSHVV